MLVADLFIVLSVSQEAASSDDQGHSNEERERTLPACSLLVLFKDGPIPCSPYLVCRCLDVIGVRRKGIQFVAVQATNRECLLDLPSSVIV